MGVSLWLLEKKEWERDLTHSHSWDSEGNKHLKKWKWELRLQFSLSGVFSYWSISLLFHDRTL